MNYPTNNCNILTNADDSVGVGGNISKDNLNNFNNFNPTHTNIYSQTNIIPEEDSILNEDLKIISYQKNKEKIIFYEFLNFLEIFIHSIIYLSNVYPKETFHEYKLYNLQFLKYISDDVVNTYITEFLTNIENLLFSRFINKIYIMIIDADTNTMLEIYNMEVDFADKFYQLNYEDLKLNFKSVLYKLFITYGNKNKAHDDLLNKTFSLCIETKESKVLSSIKLYEEIVIGLEENFVKNLFKKDILKVFENRDVCVILDDVNFSINISRNYIN